MGLAGWAISAPWRAGPGARCNTRSVSPVRRPTGATSRPLPNVGSGRGVDSSPGRRTRWRPPCSILPTCRSRRLARGWFLADAVIDLGGDGGRVFVDVVHTRFAGLARRVLDSRGRHAPLDGLHLVVHRTMGAVHGESVARE